VTSVLILMKVLKIVFSASCWEVSSNQVITYGLWRHHQFVIS